ncbi:DUF4397 domain-containing protein [Myxococcota bacterium]
MPSDAAFSLALPGFRYAAPARLHHASLPIDPSLHLRQALLANMRTASFALCLAGLAGCELVGDIEKYSYVVAPASVPPADCELPSQGDSAVRLANLAVRMDEPVDLCYRRSGIGSFATQPVIRTSGPKCPRGLVYREVSAKIRLGSGAYDFRVVPSTAEDCQAEGLADLPALELAAGETTTLVLVGQAESPQLVALPETQAELGKTHIRFVNAVVGAPALRAGQTQSARLPTVLEDELISFGDVPFGAAAQGRQGPIFAVNDKGYLVGDSPFSVSLGGALVEEGEEPADALFSLRKQYEPGTYTLYAVGQRDNSMAPPRLMSCDERPAEGILSVCGAPVNVTTDVFGPYLTDLFANSITARSQPLAQALSETISESDLVCLSELNRPADVAQVIAAAKEMGFHILTSRELVEAGQFGSALEDQNGNLPTPSSEPICGQEEAVLLEGVLECLESSPCLEQTSEAGTFRPTMEGEPLIGCFMSACQNDFGTTLVAAPACFMCLEVQLASYRDTQAVRDNCSQPATPESKPGFAFDGETGLVVLSRDAIDKKEASLHLLPSTSWQRGVLRAPLLLSNGVPVDFYCTSFSEFRVPTYMPYTGPYGNGQQQEAAVIEEQRLQAVRLAEFVQAKSQYARPIIAGLFYSGPETGALQAFRPEAYELLMNQYGYEPLVPAGYTPACTFCPDNPLNSPDGEATGQWTTHLLGTAELARDVQSTSVTFTEGLVAVEVFGKTVQAPISPHYGLRSVLRIRQ